MELESNEETIKETSLKTHKDNGENEDLSECCRICGREPEENRIFYSLFGSSTIEDFSVKIKKYLPINIKEDFIPIRICVNCKNMIQNWDEFYHSCLEAERKFRYFYEMRKNCSSDDTQGTNNSHLEFGESSAENSNRCVGNVSETVSSEPENRCHSTMVSEESSAINEELSHTPEILNKDNVRHSIFKNLEYHCSFCEASRRTKSSLNEHLLEMHADEIFFCEICSQYQSKSDLMAHMIGHATGITNGSRTDADEDIQDKSKAKNTVTSENGIQQGGEQGESKSEVNPKQEIKCKICDRVFTNSGNMKHHIKTVHDNVRNFECKKCGKLFTLRKILLNHEKSVHLKIRDIACEICGKEFKTSSTLYTHKKIHNKKEDYKFECVECGKTFKFKHHLHSHSYQHVSVKREICPLCGKKFLQKNNLRIHMKIHSNTEFRCHICGDVMKQKRYLKAHMENVHKTKLITNEMEENKR